MMKKNLLPVLVLVTGLVVISCDGFVSKVQVKGSPTFHAPLGSKSYSVSKYISVAKIREMMGADEPDSIMAVYEYPFAKGTGAPVDPLANPSDPFVPGVEDTNMRFLVHYPLTSVDLDFSTYLENIGFAADISASMPSQNFTVPTIARPAAITIDFNAALLTALNVIPSTVPVVTLGAGSVSLPAVAFSFTGFDTATFSAGALELAIDAAGLTGLTLTGIRILDSSDVVVASATDLPRSLSGTITVPVPLTGATFSKNMQIAFDLTATGATSGTLQVAPQFTPSTRLSAASGVFLSSQTQDLPLIEIPAISDPSFVQATVGTGNITMDIGPSAQEGSLTDFNRSLTLTVQQTGGLNAGVTNDTSEEPTIPLAGEIINREAIGFSGSVTLSATNASFSGLGAAGLVFSVTPTINIEEFSSVTMKPGAGFEFEKEVTVPLSQDLRDWVTSIAFNEVGLKINFTNGLPAGNNIGVTVTSTAFGINKTDDLLAPKSPASAPYSFTNGTTANPYSFVPASHTNIDYTFKFNPPGYNQVAGTMTLTNLSPGTFVFSLDSVEMVSDWVTVTIDPQEGFDGTFPEAGGSPLDFSTLTDYLGEGLGFAEIPMYLYISGPELTATAGVAASYWDKDNVAKTADLLDAGTTINKVDPPVFTQTDNVISAALSEPSASLIRFADVMNDSPSDLSISYNIDIAKISLTKAQVEAGATLKADLVIVFPLAFKAEGATNDVAKLELLEAGTSDLLGREVGSEDETLDDVFNNLKSMEMVLDLNNKLGLEGTLILSALNSVPGGDPFIKEISMGSPGFKESILDLTKEDIDFIKTNNPFTPSFSLEIPNGNYYLQRNAGIDVKITLNIETDINYEIDLQGGK